MEPDPEDIKRALFLLCVLLPLFFVGVASLINALDRLAIALWAFLMLGVEGSVVRA